MVVDAVLGIEEESVGEEEERSGDVVVEGAGRLSFQAVNLSSLLVR
jgi:hypothetical protein